jgi:hypothetical protein
LFTLKSMRWILAFILVFFVFSTIYTLFEKYGRLAGYISLSIALTILWILWSKMSIFYFYEILWDLWYCFYRVFQFFAIGMLGYYAWIKCEPIRDNKVIFTCTILIPLFFGILLWNWFSRTLFYFVIAIVVIMTAFWPLLTHLLIQIYSCFAIAFGLWYLTDPGDIGKIAILFNAPDEYVYAIFVIVFIPAIVNLLITENCTKIEVAFRFNYNFVLTLLVLTAIKKAYIELAAISRNYELDCRNPTENGRCMEYVLYNTETKHAGHTKTTLSAVSNFISPFLPQSIRSNLEEIRNLFGDS